MVDGGNSTEVVFTMPPPDRSHLVFAKVTCGNHEVEAIIDTESGISVISPEFCQFFNLAFVKPWVGPKLLMANGIAAFPSGSVPINVVIQGITVGVQAAVLSINGYNLLLGNDALRQLDPITICYEKDSEAMFFPASGLDLNEGERKSNGYNQGTVTIPAYSMVTVTVKVIQDQSDVPEMPRMVQPASKLLIGKGFSVGYFLIPEVVPAGVFNIQLANFLRNEQWLNERTVLGSLIPVELTSETVSEPWRKQEVIRR